MCVCVWISVNPPLYCHPRSRKTLFTEEHHNDAMAFAAYTVIHGSLHNVVNGITCNKLVYRINLEKKSRRIIYVKDKKIERKRE